MKYKPEWKGRLRVLLDGQVLWDNEHIGYAFPRQKDDGSSGVVFMAYQTRQGKGIEFYSKTNAVGYLIAHKEQML